MKKQFLTLPLLFLLTINSFSQVNQEWAVTHQAKSSDNDAVTCIDAYGYIYVAGTYESGRSGKDWKIIKYSPAGTDIWIQTYNGTSSGHDFVHAITCDANFNIYVTGSSLGSNGDDYTTMKLDNSGNITWASIYNGAANGNDIAKAIKVDASGNVYVTGQSAGSGTGKDIATVKYTSNGSQSWASRYNGSANNDDVANALTLDGSNVIVTGFTTTQNGIKNAVTVKYSSSGSQSWASIFHGTGGDDFATAITTDNNNNIYITGSSDKSNQHANYFTIKYNSSGVKKWNAAYNGPANNDDQANAIVYSNGYLYVTGQSKGTTSGVTSFDYATIKYNTAGAVQWLVRYNAPANGDDVSNNIIADYNGDIIITGTSHGDTTGLDFLTIAYDNASNILWSKRYTNPSFNGDDYATSLAADLFGNVYVTGSSAANSSAIDFATVKYADQVKNNAVITDMLQTLAVGLLNESQNDTVKTLVYASCELSVDSFYHIRYDSLIARAEKLGLPLKSRMNSQIAAYFSLPSSDYVGKILATAWVRGNLSTPFLAVLNYPTFLGTSQINDNPKLTYSYKDFDFYPVSCINCSGTNEITESDAETILTWSLVLFPGPIISRSIFICNCTAQLDPFIYYRCQVCPTITSVGGIGEVTNYPGLMDHEIEIDLGESGTLGNDNCYNGFPQNANFSNSVSPLDAFGRLSKIQGFPYYERINIASNYAGIKKLVHPIEDRDFYGPGNGKKGDVLTLCSSETDFNSWDENFTTSSKRFGLGWGVYKINRPGINQQPVYFAFPYSKGLWYGAGPDMRIYYGDIFQNQSCYTNGPQDIGQDYETRGCEFCSYSSVWGIPQQNITDYLASTNYTAMANYWLTNGISVGFITGAQNIALNSNVKTFPGVTNPTPCTPPTTTPKVSLILRTDGTYEYLKPFDNSQTYVQGTSVTIHVQAKFSNGESIDDCITFSLANNPNINLTNYYSLVTVEIRGNIKDYDINNPTVIQYQVDVY